MNFKKICKTFNIFVKTNFSLALSGGIMNFYYFPSLCCVGNILRDNVSLLHDNLGAEPGDGISKKSSEILQRKFGNSGNTFASFWLICSVAVSQTPETLVRYTLETNMRQITVLIQLCISFFFFDWTFTYVVSLTALTTTLDLYFCWQALASAPPLQKVYQY